MPQDRKTNKSRKDQQLSCVPPEALMTLAEHMGKNQDKYGRDDYRNGGEFSLFFDAAFRHMMSWWQGEDFDPENGSHHLDAAAANLMMLRYNTMTLDNPSVVDDRPDKDR